MSDRRTVHHPDHYTLGGVEVIDAIEAWDLGFSLGNAIKYVARAGKKDPLKRDEDLSKAIWYIRRELRDGNSDLHHESELRLRRGLLDRVQAAVGEGTWHDSVDKIEQITAATGADRSGDDVRKTVSNYSENNSGHAISAGYHVEPDKAIGWVMELSHQADDAAHMIQADDAAHMINSATGVDLRAAAITFSAMRDHIDRYQRGLAVISDVLDWALQGSKGEADERRSWVSNAIDRLRRGDEVTYPERGR